MKKFLWGALAVLLVLLVLLYLTEKAKNWKPNKPQDMELAEKRLVVTLDHIDKVTEDLKNSETLTAEQKKEALADLANAKRELESLKESLGEVVKRYQDELQKYIENLNDKLNRKESDEGGKEQVQNPEDLCRDLSYVVQIDSIAMDPMGSHNEDQVSGLIFNFENRPMVLTVNHVQTNSPFPINYFATINNKTRPEAIELVGYDPKEDIATFKFSDPNFVHTGRFAEFGKSSDLKIGTPVMSVGSPFGFQFNVTFGNVTKLDVGFMSQWMGSPIAIDQPEVIAHSASISNGNSGGPLVSRVTGKVVGINAMIISDQRTQMNPFVLNTPVASIFLAIPIDEIAIIIPKLMKGGEVKHGMLKGALIGNSWEFTTSLLLANGLVRPKTEGPMVVDLDDASPAQEAGFKKGDIIREVNGTKTDSYIAFYREIMRMAPGETAKVRVLREYPLETDKASQEISIEFKVNEGGAH